MRVRLLVAAFSLVVAGSLSSLALAGAREARLTIRDDVPHDVAELAAGVWDEFTDVFAARLGCIDGVELATTWEMDDRARYVPDAAAIELRIPATANKLREALVHELAHHVEFTCTDHADVRPAFSAAQGLPDTAPWLGTGDWAEAPSEHWAEAVVEVVLGKRTFNRGTIRITPSAREVVHRWATEGP